MKWAPGSTLVRPMACSLVSPSNNLKPQALPTRSNWSVLYQGRGLPVTSWILLKANNGQQAWGVGDKRFFRFKQIAYHLWTAIKQHCLNDSTHQQVMRFNQGSRFANIFTSPFKISPMLRDTRAGFSLPVEHARHDTTDLHWPRMCWMVMTWLDFGPNEYHIWHGWPSTCWHVENKSLKYEVPIFTVQACNHWRKSKSCVSVPKTGLLNWYDWILCQCQ